MRGTSILLMLCASICVVLNAGEARAQSCLTNNDGGPLTDTDHLIYVYIEDDMSSEMRNYSGTYADVGLEDGRVIHTVMGAAEIWNQQTRGVAFVFGGLVDADDDFDFCELDLPQPGYYVHLDEDKSGTGATHDAELDACPGDDFGEIYLKKGGANGTGNNYWPLGSQSDTTISHLVHEFGHAVGLADIGDDDGNCGTHASAFSVMNGCASRPAGANGRVHPLNWDKNCADSPAINTAGRSTSYQWLGWTNSGSQGENELDSRMTGRGSRGAYWVRSSTGGLRYAMYLDDAFLRAYATGTNGYLEYYQYNMDSTELVDLEEFDVAPFFFSPFENLASADAMRVSFVDDENDSSGTQYNPPYAQYEITHAELSGSPSNDASFKYCDGGSCSTVIRTHLPVAAVWDPVQTVTVFGWVETDSDGGDSKGWLRLHAGLYNTSTLNQVEKLSFADLGLPSSTTNWNWMGRTHHPIGLACADTTSGWNGYNCMIAWNDRGLASSADETLLYKLFRVNSAGDEIEVSTDPTKVIGYSNTAGPPSLGFLDDKMWVAFKNTHPTPQVEIRTLASASSNWIQKTTVGAAHAVDAPFFQYGANVEAATIWTVGE